MENFIYDYYIAPIWSHAGYNIINTLTYAAIALLAVYLIHKAIRGRVKVDGNFIKGTLTFVLFGSTIRVVTDSIENGIFQPVTPLHGFVLDSHLWDYGYLTVTPGIYIVTAALLLISIAVLHRLKKMELLGHIGLVLWLPHLLLLLPFMDYAVFAIPILILAAIPAYAALRHFRDWVFAGIVAGHALDGAATFFVIDFFSSIAGIQYFEQHILSAAIGGLFGTYFTFYLLKIAIAFAAAYVLTKEKMDLEETHYVALVLMILGFAPGIRDVLRMVIRG